MGWSDWIHDEGGLSSRFKTEGATGDTTNLVKQTIQPDRPIILAEIAAERKAADLGNKPNDLEHGRYIGSIPLIDYYQMQKSHPDIFSPDAQIARAATIKFMNSTEGAIFRVQKA